MRLWQEAKVAGFSFLHSADFTTRLLGPPVRFNGSVRRSKLATPKYYVIGEAVGVLDVAARHAL